MVGWRAVFGHDEPYPNQVAGIERVLETFDAGGFLALEGACGTGKTMLALTAALHAVRAGDTPYERVFVITSVKSQLRQFEEDLARIERARDDDVAPVTALTLVGKGDVCPYRLGDAGGMTDQNVYDRCERLRDRTRELVEGGHEPSTLAGEATVSRPDGGLQVGEATAPYPPSVPTAPGAETGRDVEYCPFYAQYLDDAREEEPTAIAPFDYRSGAVITPDDLVARSAEYGTCPHSLMGVLLEDVEVVVGNYNHAFDDRTASAFTGALFDRSTILIVDEAHTLESRVRDLASRSLAVSTIERARDELADVIEYAKGRAGDGERHVARRVLEEADLDRADLSRVHTFLGAVIEAVDGQVAGDAEPGRYPLRDPETPERDVMTATLDADGHEGSAWQAVGTVAPVAEYVLNTVDGEERWRATPAAGRFLDAWWTADHHSYLRTVDVPPPDERGGMRLALHNCLPTDVVSATLDRFGAGVLMSATLAPTSVFTEATGLAHLAGEGRPVQTARFGLPFPASNRLSLVVDAPKFTYSNRGAPDDGTAVRRTYGDVIAAVASSPGNTLVGMPSYREARWAAEVLEDRIDRSVLVDRPSDRAETEALKASFFAGEAKVLVTSLRGTLTEGVDYPGDRLASAVICGVPIVNTNDVCTTAMQAAYDDRFGDGFEHALVTPAVRKARQALGRVIRGPDEVGVRVLVDGRYARDGWDGVADHLPEDEDFTVVDPAAVPDALAAFWATHHAD